MKKPRVAFIIPQLSGRGGWATFATGAIRALEEYVQPVLYVAVRDYEAAKEKFPRAEHVVLPVIHPEDWSGTSASLLRRVLPSILALRKLKVPAADLVHSLEMFPTGWFGSVLAKKLRVPHVLTAHGTYAILWRRWAMLDVAYRSVLRSASAVCAISNGTKQQLETFYAGSFRKTALHLVFGGVDIAKKIPAKDIKEKTWPSVPHLLSVGAIKPRKGYHVSIEAFGTLQKRFPDARYTIVGRGIDTPYHGELLDLIAQQNIGNVTFTGSISESDLDSLYRQASMFALLSQTEGLHFEGFGLVFLEAGAYGLPVIGTRCGGIPDAVHDGENGLLVPQGNTAAAAGAMVHLAEHLDLSARLGVAGRGLAESLTWERYAFAQWQVYREARIR